MLKTSHSLKYFKLSTNKGLLLFLLVVVVVVIWMLSNFASKPLEPPDQYTDQ